MTTTIDPQIKLAIAKASQATGVSERILLGFAQIESNFNVNAESKKTKEGLGGVKGLFQITEGTWHEIWKREGQPGRRYSKTPEDQALAAALYIKWLAPQFQFDQNLIAIAYNAGPAVAKRLIGKELIHENIREAISKFYSSNKVASKTEETARYPINLAKALGETFKAGMASAAYSPTSIPLGETKKVASSQPVEINEPADASKPFFDALTNNTRNAIARLASVLDKLDNGSDGKNGQLRAKLEAHPKLAKLFTPEYMGGV
jgi:hypothetical protein